MDFDPRDYDSRDDDRFTSDRYCGARGSAHDEVDRDDDLRLPESHNRDRGDDAARKPARTIYKNLKLLGDVKPASSGSG